MTASSPAPEPPRPEPAPQAPQQWAWARPALIPVETEPLEYHRLYRGTAKYRWWKPILVVLISASIYFIFNITFSLLLLPAMMAFDTEYLETLTSGSGDLLDTQHPISLVLNLVTIALMIPAVILGMLAMGVRPTGRIWSVAGRIRWSLLWRTTAAAVLAVLVMNGVGLLAELIMGAVAPTEAVPPASADADFSVAAAVTSFILVLLLVPLQATAEEVVFRGLFLQVLGSWLKSPWLAIAISTVAFSAGHIYDIWGLVAVGLMGLVAAWLTWKTGGLEAAIGIHIINNIAAFAVMASGISGETAQTESTGGPLSVVAEVIGLALFAWLTLRIFHKHGYGRERIDTVLRPAPQQIVNESPAS